MDKLPIGPAQCQAFTRRLETYRAGKRALDARIVAAEEYWSSATGVPCGPTTPANRSLPPAGW